MGRGPQDGVVDEWGRAFGVPGLHVPDRFSDAIVEGRPEP